MKELEELYNELKERLKDLETRQQPPATEGRITELLQVIIRIQDKLIKNIKNEN